MMKNALTNFIYSVFQDLPHEWRNVFYVGAAFYAFGTVFYDVFASGELQPWAKDKVKELDIILGKS
jgi:ACS family sodium-dependent inorganic phosphate cotransporter